MRTPACIQEEACLLAGAPVRRRRALPAAVSATARNTSPLPAIIKLAAAGTLAVALGGCSLNSKTAGLETEPALVTSSVTKPIAADGIDSTDAELIKETVVKAQGVNEAEHALAWSNPGTGNRGTIMAIDQFVGNHGQQCKKFRTTVDSFMGIALYNGETCELRQGMWVLSWFLRDRAQD